VLFYGVVGRERREIKGLKKEIGFSHPSNHSQTLTNFTLNPPTFTLNLLKVNNTNLREKEGKEKGYSSVFKSCWLCLGLRVISRLQLCPHFIFQLNYKNNVKI